MIVQLTCLYMKIFNMWQLKNLFYYNALPHYLLLCHFTFSFTSHSIIIYLFTSFLLIYFLIFRLSIWPLSFLLSLYSVPLCLFAFLLFDYFPSLFSPFFSQSAFFSLITKYIEVNLLSWVMARAGEKWKYNSKKRGSHFLPKKTATRFT